MARIDDQRSGDELPAEQRDDESTARRSAGQAEAQPAPRAGGGGSGAGEGDHGADPSSPGSGIVRDEEPAEPDEPG